MSDFGGIYKWASGIADSKTFNESDTKVGNERSCEISQLGTIREKIIEWNEGKGIKYEILSIPNTPVRSAKSNWIISEQDNNRSTVHLSSEFDLDGSEQEKKEFLNQTKALLSSILQDLKKYVENQ